MSSFTRVDQAMAATAVKLIPEGSDEYSQELRSRYRHLPSQLRSSGLAATYGFLAARANSGSKENLRNAYKEVTHTITDHLFQLKFIQGELPDRESEQDKFHRSVLQRIAKLDPIEYGLATREVSALFMWMRRLSDSVTPDDGTQEATTGE